jgi:hypothetical protein
VEPTGASVEAYRIDPVTSTGRRVRVDTPVYALAVDENAGTLWLGLAPPR